VERFLAGEPEAYDLVLLDPPYALDVAPVLAAVVPWAADVVVVERRSGEPLTWPDGLQGERARRYGEATLWYGRHVATAPGVHPG
jgi:16S rRNA (guanine966-N2)-methyltransferase